MILTVGIPTFNGAKYLGEAIQSVTLQLCDLSEGDNLEILVADNCSSDGTQALVAELAAKFPQVIRYVRQPRNVGYDRNVDYLANAAAGDFILFLGDDDYLLPGAICRLLKIIKSFECISIVCAQPLFLNIDTGLITSSSTHGSDTYCEGGDVFLRESRWHTACISSLCVNVSHWRKENLACYFGSDWIHIAAVLEIMKYKSRIAVIAASELVVVRLANPRWQVNLPNRMRVALAHLSILESMLALGYSPKVYELFRLDKFSKNMSEILLHRPQSLKEKLEVALLSARFFGDHPSLWLVQMPLLFLPNFIFRFCWRILRNIRRFSRRSFSSVLINSD
jgi:glycosyltransferase involved in cell wall biosynthesis